MLREESVERTSAVSGAAVYSCAEGQHVAVQKEQRSALWRLLPQRRGVNAHPSARRRHCLIAFVSTKIARLSTPRGQINCCRTLDSCTSVTFRELLCL